MFQWNNHPFREKCSKKDKSMPLIANRKNTKVTLNYSIPPDITNLRYCDKAIYLNHLIGITLKTCQFEI